MFACLSPAIDFIVCIDSRDFEKRTHFEGEGNGSLGSHKRLEGSCDAMSGGTANKVWCCQRSGITRAECGDDASASVALTGCHAVVNVSIHIWPRKSRQKLNTWGVFLGG